MKTVKKQHRMISQQTIMRRKRQAGVGMIEVLIALLVFAIGVLGMISMQMAAKRSSYEATHRSIATSLSRDLLERMRSNPGVLDRYASPQAAATDCSTTDCDPNELADYDMADWANLVVGANEQVTIDGTVSNSGGLLNPVTCVANDDGNVSVSIAWRGVNEMQDPNDPCGSGDPGFTGTTAGNSFRRVQTITTFISEL